MQGWGVSRVAWGGIALVAVLGCSQRNEDAGTPDASAHASTELVEHAESAHVVALGVASALAPLPDLSARFASNADGFQGSKDGVVSAGWRAAWTERGQRVGARLAPSADRPFEAGVGVSELYRLSLSQVGAASSPLTLDEGRGVYRDVYPSTDVTFAASPERLEWAYTLRDASAPTEFKLAIKLPKHLRSVRPDAAGGFEIVDENDNALLRVPRAIAVDAAGTKRDAPLRWDGNELSVRLDASGLKYPIVVDPAIETVVWQARVLLPAGRSGHMSVYDSVRKRTVIFGGSSLMDTWEWDGTVWSLRATAGPSARSNAGMAFDSTRGVAVLFGGDSGGGETWEWDGVTWTLRCTTAPCSTTKPVARGGTQMAFDAARGNTVLFGGLDGSGTALSDTWTWNGTAWTPVAATGPSARYSHGLVYDTTGSRVLLFAGRTGTSGTMLNDLWSFNGTAWSSVTTSGSPPPARNRFAFVFQSHNGRALVHAGAGASGYLYDTFELISATNTWVSAASGPPRADDVAAYDTDRQAVVMMGGFFSSALSDTWEYKDSAWSLRAGDRDLATTAYDTFRNRLIRFGGGVSGGVGMNDTWEYTGFGWTQVCTTPPCSTTVPPTRHGAAGAYDSARKQFVVFGGGGLNDTWEYDGSAWVERCTGACTKPATKWGAMAAYDSARGKLVMFGGSNGPAETWEWNGTSWTQVCTSSPCSDTTPPGRYFGGMTFDSARNRIVMFGGQHPSTSAIRGDTWEFTGSAWIQVSTTGPSPRHRMRLAFDPIRKKTIVVGGSNAGGYVGDTWEWDGSTWLQTASTAAGPGVRDGLSLDYDVARRRIVAHGGTGAYRYGDTWEYYTRGGSCTLGTDCATGFCVDGVCCEQLSCGTCQACNTTGSPGSCASVINADDPDTCPSSVASCDANGSCRKKQGQACTGDGQCASGFCANDYCCNTACNGGCDVCNVTPGTCTVLAKGANGSGCAAYFCDGVSGSCPTTCAVDTDCGPAFFCASGGICQVRRAQGGSCNVDSGGDCSVAGCRECGASLTCKDGYCCNGGCAGSCRTCAATPGTCTNVNSADDADTCTGTSTCSATATCLAKNGQACTAAGQCASGNCVDGFCCNVACNGKCNTCSATPGTCSAVAQGSPGTGATCGAYVCDGSGGACPSTCGSDADCASAYYCAPGGTCLARKAQGSTCNPAAGADCKSAGCRSCASGNCIDGFCCDSACGGACDACNGAALGWPAAANGTCTFAPVSHPGTPACVAFACTGSSASCATSCTTDAQCSSGFYCNAAGSCVAQKTQGASCNLATDCKASGTCRACATGNCVDGFCCNTACGGQCQACDVGGAQGTCVTVSTSVHVNPAIPSRVACAGTGSCAARCNGVDPVKCNYPGSALSCGSTSCTGAVLTNVGTCDGLGGCAQTSTSCGAYACGTGACKSNCASDSDCANSSYYCSSGNLCVTKQPNGNACTGASACQSGNCVSGMCCDTGCTTPGYSCSISGSLGKCMKANGTACGAGGECGSGKCVDGVCCDSVCTGQCQACNVTGSVGTCSNVKGAPVGARPACGGTGVGTTCGSQCDGTSATSCAYPTSTTSCRSASCTGGVETTAGTCDGAGVCSFSTKACGAFLCDTTSCKSTCADDTHCATGFYCKVGTCTAKETNGAACAGASSCGSGNCVNGVCCGTASCGSGERCDLAGSLGKCAKANGVACTSSAECGSGFCVDSVCCDTKCDSQCAACDATGKVGTCSAVIGAPHGTRSACAGSGAGTECGQVCNGTDMAACHYPTLSTSCGANTCTSSSGTFVETHVSVCNGAGACNDEPKTCGGFTCGGTACKSTCTTNADCKTGNYCKSGACIPIEGLGTACTGASTCTSGFCTDGVCCAEGGCGAGRSCSAGIGTLKGFCVSLNGTACVADAECASGACVDGVCCDSACDGACEACNKAGSVGKCVPIVGSPLSGHPSCKGTSTDSDCAARCDGTDGKDCKYPGATSACGKPSCGGGEEKQVSTCDGAGTCKPVLKGCAPYVCGATACLAACTKTDDCAKGNYCKSGSCVKVEGLGKVCGTNTECDSGFCADGVCCSVGSCGEGSSCAAADSTTPGMCLKKKGVACTKADDCASGRCVDGVCCDTACNGQCEACDIGGSEGTCTPVVGVPHGTDRKACDDKADTDCAKAQCDGKTRDKCEGFKNGGTTSCGADACTEDKRFQKKGACDGAGGCSMPEPKPCTPYVCDVASPTGCKSSCTADTDCVTDYRCDGGVCVQGVKCSEDRLSSIDKSGASKSCSPYRCGSDGKCSTSCGSSDDCAPGTICDTTVKACVILQIEAQEGDGGCSTTPRSTRSFAYALAALVALGVARRRREAR